MTTDPNETATDAVNRTAQEILAAVEAKDSAKVNSYYAPDAVIATPGRPAAKDGRAVSKAIRDDIADPNFKMSLSNEKTEVAGSGDLAYRHGPITRLMSPSGLGRRLKPFVFLELMITIKAAVAESKGAPFKIEELELDEPRPDEVLVRIVACGICQTDSHAWHQHLPVPLPAILGHEGAGVVERIGSTVTSVAAGDHVVLSYQACGRCRQCFGGHYPYCDRAAEANFGGARLDGSNGVHRRGGAGIAGDVHGHFFGQSSFATYALTTERNTVKVPDDVPLEILAPLGCGLQTGAGAVLNTFGMSPRESIAVFGTGAVGTRRRHGGAHHCGRRDHRRRHQCSAACVGLGARRDTHDQSPRRRRERGAAPHHGPRRELRLRDERT